MWGRNRFCVGGGRGGGGGEEEESIMSSIVYTAESKVMMALFLAQPIVALSFVVQLEGCLIYPVHAAMCTDCPELCIETQQLDDAHALQRRYVHTNTNV